MTAQGKLFAHQQRSTHRGEFPTQSCLRQSTKAHVTLIALSPARMVVSVKHNTTALQATYARALRERWCHSNILYVFGAPTVLRRRKLARSVLFVFLLADSDSDALPAVKRTDYNKYSSAQRRQEFFRIGFTNNLFDTSAAVYLHEAVGHMSPDEMRRTRRMGRKKHR